MRNVPTRSIDERGSRPRRSAGRAHRAALVADARDLRLRVHRGEADGLRRVFRKDQGLPGRFVTGRETLLVLEHAVDLDLDPAALAILDVGDDLDATVGERPFLQPGARDGVLRGLVEQHETIGVLERELGRVHRRKRAGLADATRRKREREDRDNEGYWTGVHRDGGAEVMR